MKTFLATIALMQATLAIHPGRFQPLAIAAAAVALIVLGLVIVLERMDRRDARRAGLKCEFCGESTDDCCVCK